MQREELEQAIQRASRETIDKGLITYSERYKYRTGQAVINSRNTNMLPWLLCKLTAPNGTVSWHINRHGYNYDIVNSSMAPDVYTHYTMMLVREHEEHFRAGNFDWYLSKAGYKRELFYNPWEAGAPQYIIDEIEQSDIPIPH